jgi:hypothetical protein
MKINKIILLLVSTILIMGCAQMALLQPAPGVQPVPTIDPLLPTKTLWVFLTPTSEVSETPETPEAVIPTSAPVPGWQKIEDSDYEIYLPESYVGGNTSQNLAEIVTNLRKLGGNFKWAADTIEQNPGIYELYATDSNVGPSGFVTNLSITTETILPSFSLEAYMSSASAGLPAQFQIVDKKTMVINGYEVGQIIVEFELSGLKGKELMYIFRGESSVWVMTFAAMADEYDSRLLEFVQIADSFRIKEE